MGILYNLGCGETRGDLPKIFSDWTEIRVDASPKVKPDIVADLTDLSSIGDEVADAVWASHCLEHLYAHQQSAALKEIRRILKPSGYAIIITPDLQDLGEAISADRIEETVATSPAGPITIQDMIYGYGPALARGEAGMAHRCAYSPKTAHNRLAEAGLSTHVLAKRPHFQLLCLAFKDDETPRTQIGALFETLTA